MRINWEGFVNLLFSSRKPKSVEGERTNIPVPTNTLVKQRPDGVPDAFTTLPPGSDALLFSNATLFNDKEALDQLLSASEPKGAKFENQPIAIVLGHVANTITQLPCEVDRKLIAWDILKQLKGLQDQKKVLANFHDFTGSVTAQRDAIETFEAIANHPQGFLIKLREQPVADMALMQQQNPPTTQGHLSWMQTKASTTNVDGSSALTTTERSDTTNPQASEASPTVSTRAGG